MQSLQAIRAAIYLRVSTEQQAEVGSSLESQQEACLKYAAANGYDVGNRIFIERGFTGTKLDRPELNRLLDYVQKEQIDILVVWKLDRFSRDDTVQGMIYYMLDQAGVRLESVIEGKLENTPIGHFMRHVYGYVAEQEHHDIFMRTYQGLRKRAEAGCFPSGHRARLYGYTYVPGKGAGEGVRYINEAEAQWVRKIFEWYLYEGLGIENISFRLREHGVKSPTGKDKWHPASIAKLLGNRAYIGETYVYTQQFVAKPTKHYVKRPEDEWISLPGATPPIIDREVFEAVQNKKRTNKEKASRNSHTEYLLTGHVTCGKCGRKYWGYRVSSFWGKKPHSGRFYHCAGKLKRIQYATCDNKNWNADKMESMVWQDIRNALAKPETFFQEMKHQGENNQPDAILSTLKDIERKLLSLDVDQDKLLQWALKGFPEQTVIKENERINRLRETLLTEKEALKEKLTLCERNVADIKNARRVCALFREHADNMSFEVKRMVLDTLKINVVTIDGRYRIHGRLPLDYGYIASTLPPWSSSNKPVIVFTLTP